jgi:hypothetical protein
MKMTVFWDVAQCCLVEIYGRSEVLTAFIIRAMIFGFKLIRCALSKLQILGTIIFV